MVVEGRVRLSTGERTMSEVGPGEAFGTWSLVDDSARGHRAECTEDGLTLALHRDEFYDVAAGDLALLQEVVRALAKRLRALVAERPEEARVEGEGVEKPEALAEAAAATAPLESEPPPRAPPPEWAAAQPRSGPWSFPPPPPPPPEPRASRHPRPRRAPPRAARPRARGDAWRARARLLAAASGRRPPRRRTRPGAARESTRPPCIPRDGPVRNRPPATRFRRPRPVPPRTSFARRSRGARDLRPPCTARPPNHLPCRSCRP